MLEEIEGNPLITNKSEAFPSGYKDEVFTLWYSLGKPTPKQFMRKVPPCEFAGNNRPTIYALTQWITEFRERAIPLDEQVLVQVNERMVAEKVEMLNRHADVAIEMQDMGMNYLREHENDLKVSEAVKLLVAGIEIERESRGIATTVEKIGKMSDAELNKEIEKLITRSSVEFLPTNEEDLEDADNDSEPPTE